MENPLLALFLPSLLIVPAMGLLSQVQSKSVIGREIRRKALHVGIGLIALTFPLVLTEAWMVICALFLVVAWMTAVRIIPVLNRRFGCVLHAAGRVSYGEIYFAVALAALLLVSRQDPVQYVVPVLILTMADAAAAIVGRAWPAGRLKGPARGKSLTGSGAFAIVAFVITFVCLDLFTTLTPGAIIAISAATATLTAVAEAISTRGTDNLVVPAVAWLVLYATIGGA